jgi:hypothetical protein
MRLGKTPEPTADIGPPSGTPMIVWAEEDIDKPGYKNNASKSAAGEGVAVVSS